MTNKRPKGLSVAGLIGIAATAGVLAGFVAVYVTSMGSGNGGDASAMQTSGACSGAVDTVKSVSAFSRGQVAAMIPANPPRPLPLRFNGPEGQPLEAQDFAGKTVLLNLWATWCGPCREEMPALDALQKEMGGEDFEVVAVNIDTGDDEKPKAFLSEYGIGNLNYYRDSSMGVFNALKKEGLAFGLPATLLIDGDGCLLAAMNGPAAWDSDDAKALVTAAKGR